MRVLFTNDIIHHHRVISIFEVQEEVLRVLVSKAFTMTVKFLVEKSSPEKSIAETIFINFRRDHKHRSGCDLYR